MDLRRDLRPMLNPALLSAEFAHDERGCAMDLVDLPRFSGHLGLGSIKYGSVHDADIKTSICASVSDRGGAAGQGQRLGHLVRRPADRA